MAATWSMGKDKAKNMPVIKKTMSKSIMSPFKPTDSRKMKRNKIGQTIS